MAGLWALAAGVSAAAGGDSWTALGRLPASLDGPVFALAIDPADGRHVLAGTPGGEVLRSDDGGATWRPVRSGLGRGVPALAFDPGRPGAVLAGTRDDGVWSSLDGGLSWQQQPGAAGRTVRAFAFAGDTALAGTDQGVLVSRAGGPWAPAGLAQVRVSALAAVDRPGAGVQPLVVAGGDATQGAEPLPLYVSGDAGRTWTVAPGVAGQGGAAAVAGSSMVTALSVAGWSGRPLLMGTDAGLFASPDGGATWRPLTGGGALPATDVTAFAAAARHPERLYVASDGGGSDRGGLWVSADGGAHFAALAPPQAEVTALAVSADDVPRIVVATFRPADHAVNLWAYRDAGSGSAPSAPAGPAPDSVAGPASGPPGAPEALWRVALEQPETPFVVVGVAALLAVVAAMAAYVRRGRVG